MLRLPPIKTQGIKTKLLPWISNEIQKVKFDLWIEPFMGSGVVALNILPERAILGDCNQTIINFYLDLQSGKLNAEIVKDFFEESAIKLSKNGPDFYKELRASYNREPNSLKFLLLNRICFNGLIRYNSKGQFNVPYGKCDNRLNTKFINKITTSVDNCQKIIQAREWTFMCTDFSTILPHATKDDLVYCDPPYFGLNDTYFQAWNETHEQKLREALKTTPGAFFLSTWKETRSEMSTKINPLEQYWDGFRIETKEHKYIVGPKTSMRPTVLEALITNR